MKQFQNDFINKIAPLAVKGGQAHDVCTSMTIAQAILESGWGQHCIGGFALFGVKGIGLEVMTTEFEKGEFVNKPDSFEVYNSYAESFAGYYAFLERNPRYRKHGVFGEWDYKKACQNIKNAGYATDPKYVKKLIGIIEDYGLAKYDKKVNGVTPIPQPVSKPSNIRIGSKVKVKQGARDMNTHGKLASFVYAGIYLVRSVSVQRVVIAPAMTGPVTAAINIKDLEVL